MPNIKKKENNPYSQKQRHDRPSCSSNSNHRRPKTVPSRRRECTDSTMSGKQKWRMLLAPSKNQGRYMSKAMPIMATLMTLLSCPLITWLWSSKRASTMATMSVISAVSGAAVEEAATKNSNDENRNNGLISNVYCQDDSNANNGSCLSNDNNDNANTNNSHHSRVPEECRIVMAPSGIPNSGWGVFTLAPRKLGERVTDQGDIVIHFPDANPHKAHEMRRLIWDYIWDGQETGGHYEGMRAMSVVPGMGMLVNGEAKRHNIIPHFPSVDDGGLKRGISPGAGAVTHHHNFTWLVGHDLVAGDELFLDYGPGWFRERGFVDTAPPKKWEVSHLRQTGYCLDNIAPGPSLVKGAARGGFATRDLEKGSIIAPVPVIALSSASLEMIKERTDGSTVTSTQLLKNYCFGHPDSKLLLYPYSHGINLVNHHSSIPNAKLQWWAGSILYFNKTLLELQQSSQLMLELVATRPIKNGEEIYLDYGNEWAKAWKDHVDSWQAEPDNRHISAESMNNRKEEYFILRTEKEQQSHPYPADVFTSCYYSYSDYSSKNHHPLSTTNSAPTRSITEWKPTSRVISLRNLRPCLVIRRDIARTNVNNNGDSSSQIYTVRVMNRVGLVESERIPKGHAHLVTHVPRHAIVFSDKIYTSDQHLLNSFRKEIGLGDLFPSQWKDFQND